MADGASNENRRKAPSEDSLAPEIAGLLVNIIVALLFIISMIFSDWYWNSMFGTLCCILGWIIGIISINCLDNPASKWESAIGYMGFSNILLGIIAVIDSVVGFGNFIRLGVAVIFLIVFISIGSLTSNTANSNMVSISVNSTPRYEASNAQPSTTQASKIKTYSCNCGHAFIADTGTPAWQTSSCPKCGKTCWPIK